MNVADYIKQVGASKGCHDILLLTTEPMKIIGKEYSIQRDSHFEFCAYVYAYILFYLHIQLKDDDPIPEEVHFYSIQYLMLILEKNVPTRELQIRIPDKESFIVDKLTAYTQEIIAYKQDPNYKPKFLFSSFLMYSTFGIELIYEKSKLINDTVAEKFSRCIEEFLKYLVNICEHFSLYLDDAKAKALNK
jgi:hypothetical protein